MIWSLAFREEVIESFRAFWSGHHFDAGPTRMYVYIDLWLKEDTDRVMALTGRDYATWLEIVFLLIDACHQSPSLLARRTPDGEEVLYERQVEDLVINVGFPVSFLDRHVFNMLAAGGKFIWEG
jgi:hypothetical protein